MRTIDARAAWISASLAAGALLLTGCATSQKDLLPTTPGVTMLNIWRSHTGGGAASGVDPGGSGNSDGPSRMSLHTARATLRRPLARPISARARDQPYTRTAATEIHSQFPRLPNPDLVMYVFPHLTSGGGEQVPVPGYSTVFPLFEHPHYAQPGERGWSAPEGQPGARRAHTHFVSATRASRP